MNYKKDYKNQLLYDKERLTKFDKFGRSTSLVEIPQNLNVIKAYISLIGLRPLLIQYLPSYYEI